MGLSEMSLEELRALEKQIDPSATPSIKEMSLNDLKSFEQQIGANAPSEKPTHKGLAALEGFGQGATLGYLPQIQAGAEKLATPALNALASTGLGAKMLGVPQNPNVQADPYLQSRDYFNKRSQDLAKENPVSYGAGAVGGGLAQMLIPAGVIGKGAGLLGKTAMGAATGGALGALANPGDLAGQINPLQLEARAQNAKQGAILGGAIPAVGGALEKGLSSGFGQKSLQKISDTTAVKQAGAMLKDFRQLFDKNKLGDIAGTLKNEVVQIPGENGVVTKKILEAGDTFDDVAAKSKVLQDETGKKIGSVYNAIDEKLTDPNLKLTPSQLKAIQETPRFNPAIDTSELEHLIRDKFGKKLEGKKVMAKVQGLLEDMKQRSESLTDSLALKGEIDDMINYARSTQDMPMYQQTLKEMRNYIRDKTNVYADKVGGALGVDGAKELSKLNKTYGNAATIYEMASDRVNRESANRMFGLTDTIAGIGVGAGAAAAQGDINPQAFLMGGAAGLANRAARKYGPGALSSLTQGLANTAGRLSQSAQVLKPAVQAISSPQAAGIISNLDPMQRRMDKLKRGQDGR